MIRRALLLLLLFSCATAQRQSYPRNGCAITCARGYSFRRQHLCKSGTRWFQDLVINDRKTTRGADGGVLTDVYITPQGDYPVEDVELGTCQSVISKIISSRSVEQRGVHEGEDNQGHPKP